MRCQGIELGLGHGIDAGHNANMNEFIRKVFSVIDESREGGIPTPSREGRLPGQTRVELGRKGASRIHLERRHDSSRLKPSNLPH